MSTAFQRALFLCSVALGAVGIFSGGWMIAHGHLSYVVGLLGSTIPVIFGLIGLNKLRKTSPIIH
jgi:hypothetical protein